MASFAHATLETFVRRFMPDGRPPGFVGGFRFGADARGDLICLLGALHGVGYRDVAGLEIKALLGHLLTQVSGEETETFYSYRIGETLLRFGPFAENPLLETLTEAQRAEIAYACDTTHIHEGPGKLRGTANNFWAVLARAELARERLGLLKSAEVLDDATAQVRRLLTANPLGFFDDNTEGRGRYDIYTAEMVIFTLPLAERMGADVWTKRLKPHVDLVSQLALENGASVAWGRSSGLHSILITIEMSAMGFVHGLWPEPAKGLSLANYAFGKAREWFADGLTNAHQHRSLSRYRRAPRRVQMTLDTLIKLAEMAELLGEIPQAEEKLPLVAKKKLFPPRDVLIPLDPRGAGVWSYRNDKIAFQLPIVFAHNADYVPSIRYPDQMDNPVDSDILCGVPRVVIAGTQYTTYGIPAQWEKSLHGLKLIYDSFLSLPENQKPVAHEGRREVQFLIKPDGTITAQESWTFPVMPDALSIQFAESSRSFEVKIDCAQPHHLETVDVTGLIEWRSYWGEIKRTHEVDFAPTKTLAFSWELKPKN